MAVDDRTKTNGSSAAERRGRARRAADKRARRTVADQRALDELLEALECARDGDFSVRLPDACRRRWRSRSRASP